MNRIYRLIFSKAKGCLVAVAENVTGQGKGKSQTTQVGSATVTVLNPALLKSISSKQRLLHLLMFAGLSATGLWAQDVFAQSCTAYTSGGVVTLSASSDVCSATGNLGNVTLQYGIYNPTSVSNAGTISPSSSGDRWGIVNKNNTISEIYNSGKIGSTNTTFGIQNYYLNTNTIDTVITAITNTNTGTITGAYSAIDNSRSFNSTKMLIGTIDNAGTISGGTGFGIYNYNGTITSIINRSTGTISSASTSNQRSAISNDYVGSIGTITNSGTITTTGSTNNFAIYLGAGTHGSIINNLGGVISTTGNSNVIEIDSATVGTITNSGLISAASAVGINIFGSLGTLSNAATGNITGSIGINIGGTLTSLSNAGSITGTTYGVYGCYGTLGSVSNTGTISGGSYGIYNTGSTITNLTNAGSISSIYNTATIGTITNTTGTISTLTNSQGASGSAIAYSGKLPTNYNIIINSTSDYGKLAITSPTGSMAFGIDSSSSVTADGTYSNVFTGTGLSGKITNLSGTYSSRSWTLGLHSGSSTLWDLVFGSSMGNITSPTSNLSSLGTSFTSIFDGGKLVVDSDGASTATGFTIKKDTTGAIDQGGNKSSTFSGIFADDTSGTTASKLTITNSGTSSNELAGAVTLSGVNTYTGGTKVEAGATLAVTNANAIGTGTLELVGTTTTSANFKALSSMTISNAITVQGDPTFTAAPGTTLTISSPITDGAGAGDVVIGGTGGGGTVVLTAVNTYTGNTTIEASNTLALSGAGSVATSGTDPTIGTGVFNYGTFNIAPASANTVTLGTSYTQSSSGTLGMNWYQKLSVTGTASLAGSLTLFNSNSSGYSLGRYTLLTATGGRTGTFGTLNTTNLSSGYSYSLSYDANDAYLTIAPSADYTQQSLVNTAANLQGTFALQNSILNSSLGYDCNIFGPNGVCISTGGRNTAVQAEGINNTSALLIAAYKVMPKVRIGAYADQNLSTQGPATVKLGNNTPLLGMFAAWNENLDGTGLEVKASASYGQKTATVTRSVVVTSEPGSGSSNLTTQGAQFVTKYGFAVTPKTIVTPYAGLRYSQSNMAGYTESTSTSVTSPLTYQALNTNATTLLAGASATHQLDPKTTVFASAGIEFDTNTANGSYSASSSNIAGLTPINFNPTAVNTRPTATVGAYYDLEKNQRLGITAGYAQTPFKAVSTTSVMATYTIGF